MLYDKRWDKPQVDAIGKIILDAADRLDRDGWCRGTYHDECGRHCVEGAFFRNINVKEIREAVKRVSRYLGMSPQRWNDTICVSGKEASAMLRQAALEK
jgi:hypothetical protein